LPFFSFIFVDHPSSTSFPTRSPFRFTLRGPFLLSRAVARRMAGRGGGVILNNASIDRHGGERWHAPYNASKAGLVEIGRAHV